MGHWDRPATVNVSKPLLSISQSAVSAVTRSLFAESVIIISNTQAKGVDGGSLVKDQWNTVPLTLIEANTGSLCTDPLVANTFTLAPATYLVIANIPVFSCGACESRLYNNTAIEVTLIGSSGWASNNVSYPGFALLPIVGVFTIAVSSTFKMEVYCTASQSTNGFGKNLDITTEKYAQVFLLKLE